MFEATPAMILFRPACRSLLVLALLGQGVAAARAQTSAAAPPPSAKAEGGGTTQGDPNGAVRALGSADADRGSGTVTVPDVRTGGDGHTGGVPAGTAR